MAPSPSPPPPTGSNNIGNSGISGEDSLSHQMQGILDLMTQRARGKASNDQIESAVSDILTSMGAPTATASSNHNKNKNKKEQERENAATRSSVASSLKVDMGNYDDDDDEDDDDGDEDVKGIQEPAASLKSKVNLFSTEEYKELLESIPMGHVGAQMMTTFGDGPQPNLEALKMALQGTRKALQLTIMDARALRRKVRLQYSQAKHEALSGSKRGPLGLKNTISTTPTTAIATSSSISTSMNNSMPPPAPQQPSSNSSSSSTRKRTLHTGTFGSADSAMVYRAFLTDQSKAHDPLAKQPPCGFDVEQLGWLCPEEVRAYDRWNELHSAYEQSKQQEQVAAAAAAKKKKKKGNSGKDDDENGNDDDLDEEDPDDTSTSRQGPDDDDDDDDDEETKDNQEDGDQEEYVGGHLKERAAVFDVRTVQMPQDNYIQFSKVRQGSFLPRGLGRTRSKLELEWEELESRGGRGRVKGGSWMHMPAVVVRFLHWLGFEPPEVPPPDNETTQVLAFLGYDRMGRIVEKAIYLRNLKKKQRSGGKATAKRDQDNDIENPSSFKLRELSSGEQLTADDIKEALEDPDVKPAPLFGLDSEKKEGELPRNVQLYFGPGFEQRLELELEEMLAASKHAKAAAHANDDNADEDEEEILKRERELLKKMSQPPEEADGLVFLLRKRKQHATMVPGNATVDELIKQGDDDDDDDDDSSSPPIRKSRRRAKGSPSE